MTTESPEPSTSAWPSWRDALKANLPLLGSAALGGVAGALATAGIFAIAPLGGTAPDSRLAALEQQLSSLAPQARVQALDSSLSAISGRVAALEKAGAGPGDTASLQSDINAARGALDALAARVASLEQRGLPPGTTDAGADSVTIFTNALNSVMGDITALKAKLGAIEDALPPADLASKMEEGSQRLASIDARVGTLERTDVKGLTERAAMALALANLTRAGQTSEPFASELTAFALIDPQNPVLGALRPIADDGAPTLDVLTQRFDALVPQAIAAAQRENAREWYDQLMANLLALVTVRPTGEVEGMSVEAILARAELRLHEKRLAEAVDEMAHLTGAAAQVAEPWLLQARRRVSLNAAIAQLNARLLTDLGAPASP
ncbi:MAG: hypothetical protein HXY22_10580 [Alphaproteobacteria bacterium]|nr:hypothetical protein [Alphaproteobacteria bacterium]